MQHDEPGPDYGSADDPTVGRRRNRGYGAGSAAGRDSDDDMGAEPDLLAGIDLAHDHEPDIPPLPAGVPPLTIERGDNAAVPVLARSNLWPIMLATVAIVMVAGLGLWIYGSWAGRDETGEVPLLLAEEGPEKVRPAEEGGLEVPNQDVLIYDELAGQERAAEPETLLPEPETPLAPPMPAELVPPSEETATATTAEDGASAPTIENSQAEADEEDVDIPKIEAPSLEVEPAAGADTTETATPPAESPAESVEPELPSTQTAVLSGAFRIQLAAVKSEAAAKAAWTKLSKLHGDQLGGMSPRIEMVDRGADGVLYRVQAGPLADRAAAQDVCAQLKKKNQPCLVVAP
ncbi:MAG: SPOR domain-containing protein [Dongiaceae bacterium]